MSQRLRVVTAQGPTNDDPLRFVVGDTLHIERSDPDEPAWLWATGPEGRSGWVHATYLSGSSGEVRGIRDYDASELDVQPGNHGEALEHADGWWWCQLAGGRRGWVRARHVEIL